MARKKPARTAKKAKKQAKKKSASKPAARKMARKSGSRSAKKAPRKAAKKAAKKTARRATKPARKPAARTAAKAARRPAAKATAARRGSKKPAPAFTAAKATADRAARKPNLDRPRKTVADVHGIPSSLDLGRTASAARTGRAEMKERLAKNTSASPALTSGDVDADWEAAASVGDEAPGGDNPTPDQDVVDEIGRALGVEYDDDEELQGGAEIANRDRNRWELDPSSKDDFDEEES
jgi:hypothetical protein